jgi:7-keto-8-aminopelargonate synthetase-like enzyme
VHLSPEIHERQRKLVDRILRFNALADARGLPLGSRDVTPIRFVRTGDSDTTFRMAADLMRDGFYVNTAVFPAVTQGQGGLRIALTVHQTLDDIRDLVDAIARRI